MLYGYKMYSFDVTAAEKGGLVSSNKTTFDLEKNVESIAGITLLSDVPGILWSFGSTRLDVGGREILPEGFPCGQLMASITSAPKDKYFWFTDNKDVKEPVPVGTGKLRLEFRDNWVAPAAGQTDIWQPYTVKLLVVQNLKPVTGR